MSAVEFHDAASGTILDSSYIGRAPGHQEVLLLASLTLAVIALGRFSPPLAGLPAGLALAAGLGGAWLGLFVWGNYFLPLSASFSGMLLGFTVAVTQRVGVEHLEKQRTRSMLARYLAPGVVQEVLSSPGGACLGGPGPMLPSCSRI